MRRALIGHVCAPTSGVALVGHLFSHCKEWLVCVSCCVAMALDVFNCLVTGYKSASAINFEV